MSMKDGDFSDDEVDRRISTVEILALDQENWEYDEDDVTRILALKARHASREAARRRTRFLRVLFVALFILGITWRC